ncbi:hypothetical protein Trydic_g12804 [Trypoxylus dichotomus]
MVWGTIGAVGIRHIAFIGGIIDRHLYKSVLEENLYSSVGRKDVYKLRSKTKQTILMESQKTSTHYIVSIEYISGSSQWQTIITILLLIWLFSCIITNTFLTWTLSTHKLYQNNFYFIIICWSLANVLQTFNSLYNVLTPKRYVIDPTATAFLVFNCVTTQILMMLATAFTFDEFVNSTKYCRKITYNNFTLSGISLTVSVTLIALRLFNIIVYTIIFSVITSVTFLIYVGRLIYVCVKKLEEGKQRLRLAMCGFCIITNYPYVIWLIMKNLAGLDIPEMHGFVTFVIYTNGLVNVILLNRYDLEVHKIFKGIYKKSTKKSPNK